MDKSTYNDKWRQFYSEYEKIMFSYNEVLSEMGYQDISYEEIFKNAIKEKKQKHLFLTNKLNNYLLENNVTVDSEIKTGKIEKILFPKQYNKKIKLLDTIFQIKKEKTDYNIFYEMQKKIVLTIFEKQKEKNKKILNDLKNQVKIVDDFKIAYEALEANDESALYCLIQWDLFNLFKISKLWKRLQQDKFLSQEDWSTYLSVRKPKQKSDNITFVRRTYEDTIIISRDQLEALRNKESNIYQNKRNTETNNTEKFSNQNLIGYEEKEL